VLDFELTFLGDALERLAGILDAILIVVAIGRQQPEPSEPGPYALPYERSPLPAGLF
jgi:hypothetical protein